MESRVMCTWTWMSGITGGGGRGVIGAGPARPSMPNIGGVGTVKCLVGVPGGGPIGGGSNGVAVALAGGGGWSGPGP